MLHMNNKKMFPISLLLTQVLAYLHLQISIWLPCKFLKDLQSKQEALEEPKTLPRWMQNTKHQKT